MPVALGDEVEVARARGRHGSLERLRAGVRDGAGRKPLVRVRRVRVVRIVLDRGGRLAREAGARGGLLGGDEAPVARRGVALEAPGVEGGIAQAVEEDARDEGALLV